MADNRKLSTLPSAQTLGSSDLMYVVREGLSSRATLGQFVTFAAATMQPAAGNLTALSGLEAIAGRLPYFTGTDAMATAPTSAFGRSLLNLSDAAAARISLGAAAQADVQALAEGLALKADSAVSIIGAGLVTGGGALSGSRTLSVAEASEAEALAGTAADKAMTPRRTKAVVEAAVDGLQDAIDNLTAGQAASAVVAATWSELSGYATGGRVEGDYGKVVGSDSGTHTDPVAGGTVDNRGIYAWSEAPAGWRRVADLDADAAAASAAAAEAAQRATGPNAVLPSIVSHFYPIDEGTGDCLRDMIGTADADLTTGENYAWVPGGWLRLNDGWFKLPSMAHRCIIVVLRAPHGMTTGYYYCNKDGLAVGPTYGNSPVNIPSFKMLSGWGIHDLTRRIDSAGSGPFELQGGGWIMPAPVFASTVTGTPVIGAANTGGAGAVGSMELAGIYVLDGEPAEADLRCILDYERGRQLVRKIYLTFDDCPEERVLIVAHRESTDEGTFYAQATGTVSGSTFTVTGLSGGSSLLAGHVFHNGTLAGKRVISQLSGAAGGTGTYQLSSPAIVNSNTAFYYSGLPIESQNSFSQTTFVSARNGGSATTFNPMARLSAFPGYQNNVAPNRLTTAPTSGWEMGFKAARNERPDDGRQADLLKVAQGSTYLLPGGDNNTSASTNYVNAIGTNTAVMASQSRNAGLIPGGGLFSSLFSRNLHRAEQHARNLGVGYSTVIFVGGSEGLNDAYIGDQAVTSDALYLALLEAEREFIIADTGIRDPKQIIGKPHHPTGVAPGVLGVDPDYPNNPAGTSRLTALNRIRNALDGFAAAHPNSIALLDGNAYGLNTADGDWAHPDASGYDAMGRDIDDAGRTKGFYSATINPLA